jgi:hypothetical protein
MYLTSNLLDALVSDQAILRKEIIAERNCLLANLLKDFLFITASDQANVSECFQIFETLNHRLLNGLNKVSKYVSWFGKSAIDVEKTDYSFGHSF